MSETPHVDVAPAEGDNVRMHGITIASIDQIYDEIAHTNPVVFKHDETVVLTDALKDLKERIRRLTLRDTEGSEESADRVVIGFLFAHRLVRRTNPGFTPSAASYQHVLERVMAFATEKKVGTDGRKITYFPTLEETFQENPAAFDHLLNKFTNEDARWGAQVLLLAAIDQVVVGTE